MKIKPYFVSQLYKIWQFEYDNTEFIVTKDLLTNQVSYDITVIDYVTGTLSNIKCGNETHGDMTMLFYEKGIDLIGLNTLEG